MIPLSRLVDLRTLGGLAVLAVLPSTALAQAVPVFEDGQAQIVPAFENPEEWIRQELWVETEFVRLW